METTEITAEVDVEFTVWLQFDDRMYTVGTINGTAAELGDLTELHRAVQDALVQVSQGLGGNAIVRLYVPAVTA